MQKKEIILSSIVLQACFSLVGPAVFAQSDLPVTTTRVRNASGIVPEQVLGSARISEQPRYYLDTVDNLNRITSDLTRNAPGLTKNNYITQVYPVHHTEAIQIQTYLLRSLAFEGGVVEVMGADDVEDADGNGVQFLFVTAPDFMIPGITEMVAMVDRPNFRFFDATGKDFGAGPGAVQYVGRHRTASELREILLGTELGNIGVFLFPPFADDSTNTIYIVDNPSDIADNIAALAMFDIPPLQVELDVTIYELNEENRSKLGLDWDSWKRFFGGSFGYETGGTSPLSTNGDVYSTLLTLDARVLADFLNYTAQSGSSRVLTSTKVTMVNSEDIPGGLTGGNRGTLTGNPAVIESIVSIPFTMIQDDLGPTNAPNARNEILADQFEGVRVEILPFIGTESTTLHVDALVSSVVGFAKDTDAPILSARHVNSVVNVKDGHPIVIGGLDKTSTVTSRVGIPGLKDIPVAKYLFSKESKSTSVSKVLITIVPRLKKAEDDAALAVAPDLLP